MEKIEFIYIPKKEFELLSKAKENSLTSQDGEILLEYWDVFEKFLRKTQFSYQLSLSEWKARWIEESVYSKIEWINEVIKSLKELPKSMEAYNQKKAEEAEKLKNK